MLPNRILPKENPIFLFLACDFFTHGYSLSGIFLFSMDILGLSLLYFFVFLRYIVVIDVILSWLPLFGIEIYVPFFRALLFPIYKKITKLLPTTLGSLDFTPFILILMIMTMESLVRILFPSATLFY